MLVKNVMQNKFKLLTVIFFSKHMHCGIRFFVAKINNLSCVLNGVGIADLVLTNSVFTCSMILPYDGLHNGTKSSIFIQMMLMFCTLFKR